MTNPRHQNPAMRPVRDPTPKLTVTLDAADLAALRRLAGDNVSAYVRGLVRQVIAGAIVLPGWRCSTCNAFNGEEKERSKLCRACGKDR